MIQQVQKAWMERRLVNMLLMDIESAFSYVRSNWLIRKMDVLGANRNLVRWTNSFMSRRRINLVVAVHQC